MAETKIKNGHKTDYSIRLIARIHHELNCKLNAVTELLQKERHINKKLRQRIVELEMSLSKLA